MSIFFRYSLLCNFTAAPPGCIPEKVFSPELDVVVVKVLSIRNEPAGWLAVFVCGEYFATNNEYRKNVGSAKY